jgi:hypothetical protein
MRAPDACWALKAMTAGRLPVLLRRAGVSAHLENDAGIFIRTVRRSDRPMVTNGKCQGVCSADCRPVTTGVRLECLADFPTAVMTAVHLKRDLRAGSGVFVMAVKKCVFL